MFIIFLYQLTFFIFCLKNNKRRKKKHQKGRKKRNMKDIHQPQRVKDITVEKQDFKDKMIKEIQD